MLELPTGYETLRFGLDDDGQLLRITIDHPSSRLNAVDELLHGEFTRVFGWLRTLGASSGVRCVILSADGDAFSAGGDFDWLPTLRTPARLAELREDARRMIWDLLDCEVPIVVALGGHAMGLGASIVLLCDVIVAAENTLIGDPHVKVGLVAGDGGAVIWPAVLGPARAKQHLLTGDPLTASDAERLGLVNEVVPLDRLAETVDAVARRIAANPPVAVRYTKVAVNKGLRAALETTFDYSTALELHTFTPADHAEAVAAARERRAPRFIGE